MVKKPLYSKMSFMEYEIMNTIQFLHKKHIKADLKAIFNQLDDDPKATIRGFIKDLARAKIIVYTKENGYKLTTKGLKHYRSFKRKWDSDD